MLVALTVAMTALSTRAQIEVEPPPKTSAEFLAQAAKLAARNDVNGAIGAYDKIIQTFRGTPEVQEALYRKGIMMRALMRIKERSRDEAAAKDAQRQAISCWENIIDASGLSPWVDQALLELAGTYAFDMDKPDIALGYYTKLLVNFPRSPRIAEARFQVAVIQFQIGEVASAKKNFEKLIADFPDHAVVAQARIWLVNCGKHKATPTVALQQKAAEILASADAAFKSEDYRTAQTQYHQVIATAKMLPEYDKAACRLAKCLARLEMVDQALQTLNELPRVKPNSEYLPAALLIKGGLYLEWLDDPLNAQKVYRTILTDHPKSELTNVAKYQLALVDIRLGKHDSAKETLETIRAARGDNEKLPPPYELDRLIKSCEAREFALPDADRTANSVQRWKSLGDLLYAARQYYEAQRAYTKAGLVRALPEEAAYCSYQAGRCFMQLGKFDRALEALSQFRDKFKDSQWADDALLRVGVILAGPQGKLNESITVFQKLVEQYPTGNVADLALLDLAALTLWQRDAGQSGEAAQQLLEQYPDSLYAPFIRNVMLPAIQKLRAELKKPQQWRPPIAAPNFTNPGTKALDMVVPGNNAFLPLRVAPVDPAYRGMNTSRISAADPQLDTLLWARLEADCYHHTFVVVATLARRIWLNVDCSLQPIESCNPGAPIAGLYIIKVPRTEPVMDEQTDDEWN